MTFSNFKHKSKTLVKKIDLTGKLNQFNFYLVYLLIFFVFGFLLTGLFKLQLVEGRQNLLAATRTSQATELLLPPRGLIYDQNGEVLAYNSPSYALYLDKSQIKPEQERELIARFAETLGREEKELLNIYRSRAYDLENPETKIRVVGGISSDLYFKLVRELASVQGVFLESENQRRYPDSENFAHIIGYIGRPAETELGEDVYMISKVGKAGIEKVYDDYLRGKPGKEVIQKQYLPTGEAGSEMEVSFKDQETVYGNNVYLNIDSKWQKKLSAIMEEQLAAAGAFASAGVIMNSDTGEIKAMVSLPDFDNNLFVDAIKTDQYNMLLEDDRSPLLNRVIALQLPSGSVFKVVGASAALETGAIDGNTVMESEGCMQLSAGIEFCEADKKVLGNLNVVSALGKSSNVYFCKVAMRLNNQADGINSVLKYAKAYGFGAKTGVDLIGEQAGSLPSPELKKRLFNENWYIGDDCNSIIGQGLLTVTPMQMVVTVSAINNGGQVLRPQLLDRIEDQSGNIVLQSAVEVERELEISSTTFDTIKKGMKFSAEEGTASQLRGMPGNNIAKTGSADAAEIVNGKVRSGAHSWVTGCFEHLGENYCYVVMQQWGGRGFQTVPIIKKFIHCLQTDFAAKCSEIQ